MKIDHGILRKSMYKNKNGIFIILFAISIFEIFMIFRGLFVFNFTFTKHILFFISYFVILLTSLIGILLIHLSKKEPDDKKFFNAYIYSHFFIFLLCSWAIMISYYDMKSGNYPIVYLTVFISVPYFCLLSPLFYSVIIIIGTITMILVQYFGVASTIGSGYYINIIIYGIIAVLISFKSYSIVRERYYSEQKLKELSLTDQLTGINNRRAFDFRIKDILNSPNKEQYRLIMLDIDHFKSINDKYSHQVGDDCLRILADIIKRNFDSKNLFRFGGDEFIIITSISNDEIIEKFNQINASIKNYSTNVDFSISAGVYKVNSNDDEIAVFCKVDKALYKAKEGRSQCIIFEK